jgi:hypothetical protein
MRGRGKNAGEGDSREEEMGGAWSETEEIA